MHYDLSNHSVLLTLLEQVSWDKSGGFSSVLYLSKLSKSQITRVAEIRESNNYLTFITRKSWYSLKKKKGFYFWGTLLVYYQKACILEYYTAAECFIFFRQSSSWIVPWI